MTPDHADHLPAAWTLHTFSADVTIPIGHPCMGGGIAPARIVVDPLEAIGFVLAGGTLARPIVLVSVDWCEIRNDTYDAWRAELAVVAGTDPERVLVTAIHQHDAPVVDIEAQRLLDARHAAGAVCDVEFATSSIDLVARALATALEGPGRRVTHLGLGKAMVDRVSSNRRYVRSDGSVAYDRTSASHTAEAHSAPEGLIDPWLRTLSFWDGEEPILALSSYAVHPMSYYGTGEVSADFIGIARRARQQALPGVVQVYASGCSGNVTAGKYNDGARSNRQVLAARIEEAMAEAWSATERVPLESASFRTAKLRFEPRTGAGHTPADLESRLANDEAPFDQCLAALALSWQQRTGAGRPIDLPVLDLGSAILVLLPGEAYVEYQLLAQGLRPDAFVMALGYGESATGYIPTALQIAEDDENLGDWYWVSPTAEQVLSDGLRAALVPAASGGR
ncbi:MAG: hypothetical protein ACRDGI_06615 [Candidatus Limnocylindrales bacterium]